MMARPLRLVAAIAVAVAAVACSASPSPAASLTPTTATTTSTPTTAATPTSTTATTTPTPTTAATPTPAQESAWIYWLQDIDLEEIGGRSESIVVIDYSYDGTDAEAFSSEGVKALQDGSGGSKTVLAYMSIGEAESYRSYWRPEWRPGSPAWLDQQNPDWEGNFKVRYWDLERQRIIFGAPESYLDRLLAAGFNGAYLDIIDAYEYSEERGRESAEAEMVQFVEAISTYAKEKEPGFLIIPQNAPELAAHQRYLAAVDGVAQEGLHYGYEEEGAATPADITEELDGYLGLFLNAGKPVLIVDYVSSGELASDAYRRSWAKGYVPTVTVVDLDRLPLAP